MRKWMLPIAAVLALLLLLALAIHAGRLLIAMMDAVSVADSPDDDPMFAPLPERFTRPPELMGEAAIANDTGEDPSRNWQYQTLTPLDSEGFAIEQAG